MLSLLASALIASAPQVSPARPQVQARATVRIVSGVQLRLDGRPNPQAPQARPALIELERGSGKIAAKLIEFE